MLNFSSLNDEQIASNEQIKYCNKNFFEKKFFDKRIILITTTFHDELDVRKLLLLIK